MAGDRRGPAPDHAYDHMARVYIWAVQRGVRPGIVVQHKFRLRRECWERKRALMSQLGYLPPGIPPAPSSPPWRRDAWCRDALRLLETTMRERARVLLERERALEARKARAQVLADQRAAKAAVQARAEAERAVRREARRVRAEEAAAFTDETFSPVL